MSSQWFTDLQALTHHRETAMGIYAEHRSMDTQNRYRSEARYTKQGPWVMDVEVNGNAFAVNEYSPIRCVDRANEIYKEGWTETGLQTQEQFRIENT